MKEDPEIAEVESSIVPDSESRRLARIRIQQLSAELAEAMRQAKDIMTDDERLAVIEETFDDWCTRCGGIAGCYCAPQFDE